MRLQRVSHSAVPKRPIKKDDPPLPSLSSGPPLWLDRGQPARIGYEGPCGRHEGHLRDRADVAINLPPVLEKTHSVNSGCPLSVSYQAFELQHRLVRRQGDDLGRQPDRRRMVVPTSKSNELCLKRHCVSSTVERHLRSGRLKIGLAARRAQRTRTTPTMSPAGISLALSLGASRITAGLTPNVPTVAGTRT